MSRALIFFIFLLWPSLVFTQEIRYVDTGKLLSESKAAQAAKKHIEAARQVLEQGYMDLQKAWEKSDQKEKVLREGLQALNTQMRVEEQAALNVVATIMKEEISAWRAKNKVDMVFAKQDLLDASEKPDITAVIMENMNKREAKFADLPKVSIKAPEKEEPAKKSNNK